MPWICENGHIARTSALLADGATRRGLANAIASGRLIRVQKGTYSCAHLDSDALAAARAGTLIDCVSALARHDKVWSGTESPTGLHLRARPHQQLGTVLAGARIHWSAQYGAPQHPLEASPVDAILQAMDCLAPIDALACLESALHEGYLDEDGLNEVTRLAPLRMAKTLRRMDRGAHSGFETIVRVSIIDAGYRVRTQVPVPGTSDVDVLVEDCVAIEVDGQKYHGPERFISDRTKDLVIQRWGLRSMRIARPHIFEDWPETLATLDRLVAEARQGRPWRWNSTA